MLIAFALPWRIMVVFLQRVMRMLWVRVTSSSRGEGGESKFSMSHLLPSSSFFGCFLLSVVDFEEACCCCKVEALLFCRILGGLGLISGPGLRVRLMSVEEEAEGVLLLSGTTPVERREGFLCVICDASTFFRPEVTDSPRLSCSKTAPMSLPPAFVAGGAGPGGGGGGALLAKVGKGGGGGGGAPALEGGDLTPLVVGAGVASSASR